MSIYVAGGVYGEIFLLVKPSGKKRLPYVSSNPSGTLRRSTKHHSHLYRLEGNTLFLESISWEAEYVGVKSVDRVELTEIDVDEINRSFALNDYK